MRKTLLLLGIMAVSVSSFAQQSDLITFENQKASITKKSMLVLGGWSAANIITSAFATKTNNDEMHYFHQMNVQWNSINLFLAALGYLGEGLKKNDNPTLASVLKHQGGTEKTYLLNLGLDVGYIAVGLYLTERSKSRKKPAVLKGYGNAIMFQSAFLLLYDAANYFIHRKHGKKLDKMLDKVQLSGGMGGVALTYNF